MTSAIVDFDQTVTTRDGVRLATDVFRPQDDERHPVLVHRSPYAKANPTAIFDPLAGVKAGYVVVMQETRGRLASEGEFTPFHNESRDGFDTIEWAASQPWSNGAVGTFGASGNGATAVQAAAAGPPHLKCLAAVHTGFSPYEGWVYANGSLELAFLHGWVRRFAPAVLAKADLSTGRRAELDEFLRSWCERPQDVIRNLPLSAAFPEELSPFFFEWLEHATYDDYWARVDAVAAAGSVGVPVLQITGWYDGFSLGHMDFQRALQDHDNELVREESRLVVGPWDHHAYLSPTKSSWAGDRDFGGSALSGSGVYQPILMRWFDRWLKGDVSSDTGAAVRYFTMGTRRWNEAKSWPPLGDELSLYLDSSGGANTRSGDGSLETEPPSTEVTDSFSYDPSDPTPTQGGRHLGLEFAPSGVVDQSDVQLRNDVLVYVTDELEGPIEVAGRVRVDLYASTSVSDTDFCAKVVDVEPDGYRALIADGMVRARYRNGTRSAEPLEHGEVIRYEIDCWDTAHTFRTGHRIGVAISSADFPRHDRNLNVSGPVADATGEDALIAIQTIHHGPDRRSRLLLPVIPPG